MPIHRVHVVAAAQTGAFHHAVKHQTLVASRSVYQLGVPEVWYLTAWWKARVYHGTRSVPLIWLVFDIRDKGAFRRCQGVVRSIRGCSGCNFCQKRLKLSR